MAITKKRGEQLFGKKGIEFFTPELRAAGIKLIPGSSTPPIINARAKVGKDPVVLFPPALPRMDVEPTRIDAFRGAEGPIPTFASEVFPVAEEPEAPIELTQDLTLPTDSPQARNANESIGESLVRNLETIPTAPTAKGSSFGPPVKLTETERREAFASEVEGRGSLLSNLGKALTSPIFAKTLAGIGETISGKDALSELAFDLAESNAARRFEQDLDSADSATPASAISSPGLSRAGRERILEKRRVGGLQERQETRLEGEAQTRSRAETRLGESHILELQKLQNDIREGNINLEEAQELAAFSKKIRDAGPQTSEEIFEETFRILDLKIPEDVDFGGLPFEDALEIAREMNKKAMALIRAETAGKSGLSEEEKKKLREGIRLNFLAVAQAAPSFNQEITQQDKLADLRTEFAEAGGDPLDLDELLAETGRAGPQKLGERGRGGLLRRSAANAKARKLLDKNK